MSHNMTVGTFGNVRGYLGPNNPNGVIGNLVPSTIGGLEVYQFIGNPSGPANNIKLGASGTSQIAGSSNIIVTYDGGSVTNLSWNAASQHYDNANAPFANYLDSEVGNTVFLVVDPGVPTGPTQNTPTSLPQQLFGATGSQSVAGDWTTSGGSLVFGNLQNAPAGLTINTAGLISWDGSTPVGTTSGITYDCIDNNGTVVSNPFNFVVAANVPVEDTPPPTPLNAAIGSSGVLADVSGNYSLGSGGTGPLKFYASASGTAWPAELSIGETTGEISIANAATGAAGLQIRVEDSTADPAFAINDTGTPFELIISAGGTLTTPPLKDDTGTAVTGRAGMSVMVKDATATGTPVLVFAEAGRSQEANGTFIVSDPSITTGGWYIVEIDEPAADPPNANGPGVAMYRGVYLLQAT